MYQEGKYIYTTIFKMNKIQQKTQEGAIHIKNNLYSRKFNSLGQDMTPKWVIANEGKRISIQYKPKRKFQGRLILENKMPFPIKIYLRQQNKRKLSRKSLLFFAQTDFTIKANRRKVLKFKGFNASRDPSFKKINMIMQTFDKRLGSQQETLILHLEPRVND
tara:strand:- start:157 stop:642 length:486 start_codon:yes stop_codon:yes gene_type:complete